jgi:hypothetical protein
MEMGGWNRMRVLNVVAQRNFSIESPQARVHLKQRNKRRCVEQDGRRRPYHATRAVWKPTLRCSESTLSVPWPLSSRPDIPFEASARARGPGLVLPRRQWRDYFFFVGSPVK